MKPRILVVDDNEDLLATFRDLLVDQYAVDCAENGAEALKLLEGSRTYAVVISDMHMPGMNGVDLLAQCAARRPLSTRILLTGDTARRVATSAINDSHCFQVVAKTNEPKDVLEVVGQAVQYHERQKMEQEVLDSTLRGTVNLLLEVFSATAPASFELSVRLRRSVRRFADAMQFPLAWDLEMTAGLARIGMATLPPAVLAKFSNKEKLAPMEQSIVNKVPEIGAKLIEAVPRMERVAEAIRYQWKHYDGTGIPADPRKGDQIPLGARVLKIFTDRAWLELDGVPKNEVRKRLESKSGVYDPALLAASFLHFPNGVVHDPSAPAQYLMLSVDELKAGQTSVMAIATQSGQRIVAAGSRLTTAMIQRIRNHCELGNLAGPFCVQEIPRAPAKPERR